MNRTNLFPFVLLIPFLFLPLAGVGAYTYHPPFIPVNFKITSDGVEGEFDPSVHTPVGDFGYEYEGLNENFDEHFLYVAIVNGNWEDGREAKIYKLDLENENIEIWLNNRPLVARILVSADGLRLAGRDVDYITYDGKILRVDITDETISKISFQPERNFLQRILEPEAERGKFCRASYDRRHAPPLMLLVCLGDFTEILLGIIPHFFIVILGDILGVIVGFFINIAILVAIVWNIARNSKPVAYITLSVLYIWVFFGILRVWPDILFR